MKARHEFETHQEYNAYLKTYFAARALQGLCANPLYKDTEYKTIVRESVSASVQLLKQLES